jgi:glycosyltransferase involved in cell wall biosynthesis
MRDPRLLNCLQYQMMLCAQESLNVTSTPTLVSVVITNYNYARFLRNAIDSALSQSYSHVEVIVVDDGSTDDSHSVITSYGDRIVPVFKENGGQGSAFNAGFAASRGELICFLDADDMFFPQKVARMVEAWRHYGSDVIYHQLVAFDEEGSHLFGWKPWPRRTLQGKISYGLQRSGGWWPCPTTSALCASRNLLMRIFPMPEENFRTCADAYIVGVAPFLCSVHGMNEPLTLYRIHANNVWSQARLTTDEFRNRANRYQLEVTEVRDILLSRFGVDTTLSIRDHYLYQYYLRRSGEAISLTTILGLILSCSLLPYRSRVREALRIALSRA